MLKGSGTRTLRLKRTLFWIIGLSLSFGVAAFTAEIFLRLFAPQLTGPTQGVFDSQLGILSKPNTVTWRQTPFYLFRATHDSAGRRVVSGAPPSSSARVLFLGDSFTYGVGVSDEETFTSQTQGLMLKNGTNAQLINAGNPAIGTDFELRYFQVRGAAEKPVAVELFFFSNDYNDNQAGIFFDVLPDGGLRPKTIRENAVRRFVMMMPLHDFIMSHSQVAALLRGLTARQDVMSVPLEFLIKHPSLASLVGFKIDAANKQHELDATVERLTRIYLSNLATAVANTGATFSVFYIPSAEDIKAFRGGEKESAEEAALRAICASLQVKLTSLTSIVAASPYSLDELYYGEGHWKARTHALAAPTIATAVQSDLAEKQSGVPKFTGTPQPN